MKGNSYWRYPFSTSMMTGGYGRKGLRGQFLWHFDFAATGMEGRSISLPLDRHIVGNFFAGPLGQSKFKDSLGRQVFVEILYHFMRCFWWWILFLYTFASCVLETWGKMHHPWFPSSLPPNIYGFASFFCSAQRLVECSWLVYYCIGPWACQQFGLCHLYM